jgi:hypothetical protein
VIGIEEQNDEAGLPSSFKARKQLFEMQASTPPMVPRPTSTRSLKNRELGGMASSHSGHGQNDPNLNPQVLIYHRK